MSSLHILEAVTQNKQVSLVWCSVVKVYADACSAQFISSLFLKVQIWASDRFASLNMCVSSFPAALHFPLSCLEKNCPSPCKISPFFQSSNLN